MFNRQEHPSGIAQAMMLLREHPPDRADAFQFPTHTRSPVRGAGTLPGRPRPPCNVQRTADSLPGPGVSDSVVELHAAAPANGGFLRQHSSLNNKNRPPAACRVTTLVRDTTRTRLSRPLARSRSTNPIYLPSASSESHAQSTEKQTAGCAAAGCTDTVSGRANNRRQIIVTVRATSRQHRLDSIALSRAVAGRPSTRGSQHGYISGAAARLDATSLPYA